MAGEIVEASDLKPIAIQIVRECAGLPIAITTVAKALRNKPSDIWIDALDQLNCVDRLSGSIDIIGELKKLEVLDFSESNITQIPSTMSQLTKLKVLNLSSCYALKIIPPNILSKLTKQEELSLETFDRWEGEEYEGRKNASLSELRLNW
ncbi:hypothetical protein IC575_012277 [Cucumis melo]